MTSIILSIGIAMVILPRTDAVDVFAADQRLVEAIINAEKTLPRFVAKFKATNQLNEAFTIVVLVDKGNALEPLGIRVRRLEEDHFVGFPISNRTGIVSKTQVSVDSKCVVAWHYTSLLELRESGLYSELYSRLATDDQLDLQYEIPFLICRHQAVDEEVREFFRNIVADDMRRVEEKLRSDKDILNREIPMPIKYNANMEPGIELEACTAWRYAAIYGTSRMLRLLRRFSMLREATISELVFEAARTGNISGTTTLIEFGFDVSTRDHNGRDLLAAALEGGFCSRRMVTQLVKSGLNPNSIDYRNRNAIFFAETIDCCEALISSGADLTLADTKGRNLAEYHIYFGRHSTAEFLLSKGAPKCRTSDPESFSSVQSVGKRILEHKFGDISKGLRDAGFVLPISSLSKNRPTDK